MWSKQFRIWDCGLRIISESDPQVEFRNPKFSSTLCWFMGGVACACAVGWLAARIHASGHAPVGLVPVGAGILLGIALLWLATRLQVRSGRGLLVTTAFLAVLTVLSEHAWLYQDFRGQWTESRQKSAAVAMFRPESPPSPRDYFAHEWQPVLWGIDASLIVAAAVGVVWKWRRPRR